MKVVLTISSMVSTAISVYLTWGGQTDKAILFLVWGFYLKYLVDKLAFLLDQKNILLSISSLS